MSTGENNATTAAGEEPHEACESTTAWDLFEKEMSEQQNVTTLCCAIDDMLDGGVPLGRLTEVAGTAGVGKTQLCLQLVVNVQVPCAFGGVGGSAVYVDTEGSFTTKRLQQISAATVAHFLEATKDQAGAEDLLADFTVDNIFSRIFVFRCFDHIQLTSVSHQLLRLLKEKPTIKLVVVDSIAFHFRQDFDENFALRSHLLNSIMLRLMQVAFEGHVAVVVTNQMTTKFDDESGESFVVPALGDSWGHHCSTRVLLYWEDECRRAKLLKSSFRPPMDVPFIITENGIRDVRFELK